MIKMFLLPSEQALIEGSRRIGWRLDRGILPSVDDYKARMRVLGKGQRFGHTLRGRINNIDYTQTFIKREVIYRDPRAAPKRKIKVLFDCSSVDRSHSTLQMAGVAIVVCCSILALPGVSVVFQPVGLVRNVREQSFDSPSQISLLIAALRSWIRLPILGLNLGRLRFAIGAEEDRHIVLVTHFISPSILRSLVCPMGMTTVLVEPRLRIGLASGAGFRRGPFGISSIASLYDDVATVHQSIVDAAKPRLGPVLRVSGDESPLDAVASSVNAATGQQKSRRSVGRRLREVLQTI